jgi:excisionase family DNA binding protein
MERDHNSLAGDRHLPILAVRIADAARLTGIGKTKLFEPIADGTLETTHVGRRRLILYRSLCQLIEGAAAS